MLDKRQSGWERYGDGFVVVGIRTGFFSEKNLEINKRKYTFAIEKKVVEILYNIMIGLENTNTLK